MNDHPEGQPDYKFEVMKPFRSSLERQVMESIQIDKEKPEVRHNSKSEWGSNKIPRLIIDPESQYKPVEQDEQAEQVAGQSKGQDQESQREVMNNGKRGRHRHEQQKESHTQVNRQVMDIDREVMNSNMELTSKRPKLNILDHFRLSKE